ncbi:hypothetical protein VTN02DRAFT_6292 [Thermoascus thermophilus]
MTSTTLMTFLLRTSPDVRSVQLVGSWDNFTRPYSMERDGRVGAGHWRGCHTFTDIICDGPTSSRSPGRSGGLKMGGTYWYYYILDGDTEYCNEAEPVTTLCPLLPGQPVNVLHVPIILPETTRSHGREGSLGSLEPENRTMNPDDKYLNPRAPPRPQLPRLKTAPPLYQQANSSWSSLLASPFGAIHHRSVSQPTSVTSPHVRLVQRETGKAARSVSPPRSRGFRAALLNLTNSSAVDHTAHRGRSPVRRVDGCDCSAPQMESQTDGPFYHVPLSNPSSSYSPRSTSPAEDAAERPAVDPKLPFRRPKFDRKNSGPPPSIQNRRMSRSRSRDPSPLRSYLTLNSAATKRLATLREGVSRQNSPAFMVHDRTPPLDDDQITPRPSHVDPREKRLPTLPNTPSSVMDEALRALDAQDRAFDVEVLRSHFSDYTSTEGSCANSRATSPVERSRFSEWSTDTDTDTEMVSPASMISSSTINNEGRTSPAFGVKLGVPHVHAASGPATPILDANSDTFSPATVADHSPPLHPSAPSIAVSQYDGNVSGLGIEDLDAVKRNPNRHAAVFDCLDAMKDLCLSPVDGRQVDSEPKDHASNTPYARDTLDYKHSSTMQELMEELSYLGGIIRADINDTHI